MGPASAPPGTAPPTAPDDAGTHPTSPRPPGAGTRAVAALGLLSPADAIRPVRALSAGQRRKLELGRLVTRPLDLLLLDEPTNHLAPAVVEELEAALAGFTGTLITVTHDRRLRAGFRGRRLELAPEVQPVAASR